MGEEAGLCGIFEDEGVTGPGESQVWGACGWERAWKLTRCDA